MGVRSKNDLLTNNTDPGNADVEGIAQSFADNNAGEITAEDVRKRMVDTVESIEKIVSEGDFDTSSGTPFINNIRAKAAVPPNTTSGSVIVESGVQFPNGADSSNSVSSSLTEQNFPYPGNSGVNHNDLANVDQGDAHTQYLHVNGSRDMEGNLGLNTFWVNSSGNLDTNNSTATNNRGLQFSYSESDTKETVHIGSQTRVEFDADDSRMDSAKGVARAWISFNGDTMAVNSSYNVSTLERTGQGRFKIHFANAFPDTTYVAIGNSNGRAGNNDPSDFEVNSVGIVERTSTYLTFCIVTDDNNDYVNAHVNDLVVFGITHSGETADATPTTSTPAPS